MRSNFVFNRILSLFALVACVFAAAVLLYFAFPDSGVDSNFTAFTANSAFLYDADRFLPHPDASSSSSVGKPVRLQIPKINVDASFEHVGLTSEGLVGAPKRPENAGWFELSPRPGETGSSVIDGHTGYRDNQPAVFDDLHKLRPGDKIYVIDDTDAVIVFVVREAKVYGRNESAAEVFSSNDGKAHLNLITCTGDWDKAAKTRFERLVVFADRE